MRVRRAMGATGLLLLCVFAQAHAIAQSSVYFAGLSGLAPSAQLSASGLALLLETLTGLPAPGSQATDATQVGHLLGTGKPFERPASVLCVEIESTTPIDAAAYIVSGAGALPSGILSRAAPLNTKSCAGVGCRTKTLYEAVAAIGDDRVSFDGTTIAEGSTAFDTAAFSQLTDELGALLVFGRRPQRGSASILRVRMGGVAAIEARFGADSSEAALARRLVAAVLRRHVQGRPGAVVAAMQVAPGTIDLVARRLAEAETAATEPATQQAVVARALAWITGVLLLLMVVGAVYVMLGAEDTSDTSLFGVAKSQ